MLDEVIKTYSSVDSRNKSVFTKARMDISKIVRQVQFNLTATGAAVSGDVITRCFKLIDLLFENWGEAFIEDVAAIYPLIIVSLSC